MAADDRMPESGMQAPPRFDNWSRLRQQRWYKNNPTQAPDGRPNQGNQPTQAQQMAYVFPEPPKDAPNFMPTMPSYEAGLRGLEDQYAAERMRILNELNLIQPQLDQQLSRMGTDKGYANRQLDESLVERGIFDSGSNPYLRIRDIDIPYGRQQQDLAQWAGQQASSLQALLGETSLGYYQGLAELLLNNAADAAENMPMDVPQFAEGYKGYAPPQPGKPPRKKK